MKNEEPSGLQKGTLKSPGGTSWIGLLNFVVRICGANDFCRSLNASSFSWPSMQTVNCWEFNGHQVASTIDNRSLDSGSLLDKDIREDHASQIRKCKGILEETIPAGDDGSEINSLQ